MINPESSPRKESILEKETRPDGRQEVEEISPEFVKEVEDSAFDNEGKIDILLIKAGLKPASKLSITTKIWNEKESEEWVPPEVTERSLQMIENSGLALSRLDKPELSYSYKNEKGELVPYSQEHFSYAIARNQEDLDFLLRALERGDDELIGKALGFYPSAIEAYCGKRKKLDRKKLPKKIRESDAAFFTPGTLSENNWEQELQQGQIWADFIKRVSPENYKERIRIMKEQEKNF